MKNLFCAFAFLIPMLFAFTNPESPETTCPAPTNVHVTAQSSGAISFDWNDCGCALSGYKVKYVRQSDGFTSSVYTAGASSFNFNGLQAGTYTFYFWTECGADKSDAIVIEDFIFT